MSGIENSPDIVDKKIEETLIEAVKAPLELESEFVDGIDGEDANVNASGENALELHSEFNNSDELLVRCEILKKALEEKERAILLLQKELEEAENESITVGERSVEQLSSLSHDVDLLGKELSKQEDVLESKEKKINELKSSLERKDDLIEELETQIEIYTADHVVDRANEESKLVASLQCDLGYRKKAIAGMNEEISKLRNDIQSENEKNESLSQEVSTARTKLEIVNEKHRMKAEEFARKEVGYVEQIKNLENEVEQFQANDRTIDNTIAEKVNFQQKVVVLEERLKMKSSELETLQKNHNTAFSSLVQEKEALNESYVRSTKECEMLKKQIADLQFSLVGKEENLTSVVHDLSSDKSLLEKKNETLRLSMKSIEDELQYTRDEVSQLNLTIESQNEVIDSHEDTISSLKLELEDTVSSVKQEFEDERRVNGNLQLQLDRYKESEIQREGSTASKVNTLKKELETTQANLQKALDDLSVRKRLVAAMEKETKQLREQLKEKEEIKQTNKTEADQDETINELRREIEHLNAEVIRSQTKASNVAMEMRIKEDTMKLREENHQQQAFCFETEIEDKTKQIEQLHADIEKLKFGFMCTEKETDRVMKDLTDQVYDGKKELEDSLAMLSIETERVIEYEQITLLKEELSTKRRKEMQKKLESIAAQNGDDSMEEGLKELLDDVMHEMANLETDIKARKKMLSINDQMLTQSKEEVVELQDQVTMLSTELSSVSEELESTKKELNKALESQQQHTTSIAELSEQHQVEMLERIESTLLSSGSIPLSDDQAIMPIDEDLVNETSESLEYAPGDYLMAPYEEEEEGESMGGFDCIQEEFQKYIDMVEELQAKQDENEEIQRKLEKEKVLLYEQLQILLKQKADLEGQIDESHVRIREYEQLVMKFAEETEEAKGVVGSITYQRDMLHNDLYQLQQTFSWRENEIQDQLIGKQNELNTLHEGYNYLKAESDRELTERQNTINHLTNESEAYKIDLKEKHDSVQKLEQLLNDKEDAIRNLHADVRRLTDATANQNKNKDELTGQLCATTEELARVKEELSQHRTMYAQNIQALQQCFQEVSDNSAQIEQQLADAKQKHSGKCVVVLYHCIYLQSLSQLMSITHYRRTLKFCNINEAERSQAKFMLIKCDH